MYIGCGEVAPVGAATRVCHRKGMKVSGWPTWPREGPSLFLQLPELGLQTAYHWVMATKSLVYVHPWTAGSFTHSFMSSELLNGFVPATLVLERLRQEDCDLEASLGQGSHCLRNQQKGRGGPAGAQRA